MVKKDQNDSGEDHVLFAEESGKKPEKDDTGKKFKLLIVDDEKEIHVMTKLVLDDYKFLGATLEFHSAFSGEEAKKLIKKHPDAACVLLDVVMETKESGLEVAKFIREEEKNEKIRIVLRTGQPGKAPEKDVILNYDINDYKEKTELTNQKLFTTITTALRSYNHLIDLEKKNQEIKRKNIRLNEEIARRLVAESNLTKYNRSLEKMIDSKSMRLKSAITALKAAESDLIEARKLASIGNISSVTLNKVNFSGSEVKENLETIAKYQSDMNLLLQKYELLQHIISPNGSVENDPKITVDMTISDIDQFREDIDIEEILQRYPAIIEDSTRGIDQIEKAISDIKRFISIKNEKKEKKDINKILTKAAHKVQKKFVNSIDLQMTLGKLPKAKVPKDNIKTALKEIVKNAFEAVDPHGIVSISTEYDPPDNIIHVFDIGSGIEKEDLANVFKPYFTKNKKDAKGLGLSFAKAVILNNNGSISVESTIKEGTNITIHLPVDDV